MELLCAQHIRDNIRYLHSEIRRDRVPHLSVLIGARALKEIVVRERLDASRFPNRPTPALRRIVMNEVMTIFADVARDRGCRLVLDLNPKPIIENTVPIPYSLRDILMVR
jgi:hypothetical protein